MSVVLVDCTDLSGKDAHRQVVIGMVVTAGILGGLMVSILVWNASDVSLILALRTLFPVFITPMTIDQSKHNVLHHESNAM